MINGTELLRRFLKNIIETPADEAHIEDLIKVFVGVLHFYKCLQGHPVPYHDISDFIFNYKTKIRVDDLEILMQAIELKLENEPEEIKKCFRKFRRNISLAVTQKNYIQRVANDALKTAEVAAEVANKASNISGKANETLESAKRSAQRAEDVASNAQRLANEANVQIEETKKASENMMVNYVTILGIFASIIITVFGGINLTNATVKLLESEHDLPMMVFVISFLMIGFISILIILITWISSLREHTEYRSAVKWWILGSFGLLSICSGIYLNHKIKVNNECQIGYYTCIHLDALKAGPYDRSSDKDSSE
ncbi:hypothetical protein [Acinetobacter lwoffii]|jgi:uncharacterized integral membrane protein|uniref:hypothetical protein n=1 Tax=Acinetobacter lwoffii TaxID=28090 RepID=UPI0021CDAB62|nr:hypothetical protein [Acinetobacter lwoffii]MCU4419842.1 hypothetical protein [Acinetobacter lwoffii]